MLMPLLPRSSLSILNSRKHRKPSDVHVIDAASIVAEQHTPGTLPGEPPVESSCSSTQDPCAADVAANQHPSESRPSAGIDVDGNGASRSVSAGFDIPPGANDAEDVKAPAELHSAFDSSKVLPLEEGRFELVKKLSDASRNRGVVQLMRDRKFARDVAVKQMPNSWIRSSHESFTAVHPTEAELPWQDIGCTYFLNSVGFGPVCKLHGVYRDATQTYVMQSFASGGDLFQWCQSGVKPGPERESEVVPLVLQVLHGVKRLHDIGICHRDLSLENILVTHPQDGNPASALEIRIIDFGMASSGRMFKNCVRGKASYQAPEQHMADKFYDAFLADSFSIGVTLYAMLMKDYPWLSTKPGGCKCFEHVQKNGFLSYCSKRKVRDSTDRVGETMTDALKQFLERLLHLDPAQRLTLGEKDWPDGSRRSVWDEPWVQRMQESASHKKDSL